MLLVAESLRDVHKHVHCAPPSRTASTRHVIHCCNGASREAPQTGTRGALLPLLYTLALCNNRWELSEPQPTPDRDEGCGAAHPLGVLVGVVLVVAHAVVGDGLDLLLGLVRSRELRREGDRQPDGGPSTE